MKTILALVALALWCAGVFMTYTNDYVVQAIVMTFLGAFFTLIFLAGVLANEEKASKNR